MNLGLLAEVFGAYEKTRPISESNLEFGRNMESELIHIINDTIVWTESVQIELFLYGIGFICIHFSYKDNTHIYTLIGSRLARVYKDSIESLPNGDRVFVSKAELKGETIYKIGNKMYSNFDYSTNGVNGSYVHEVEYVIDASDEVVVFKMLKQKKERK